MGRAIFIGDELSASGFRLTGIETLVPEPDAVESAFADARTRGSVVIITAELARHIPPPQLEAAMLAEAPTLAIIPDVLFRAAVPDLTRRLRSVLGIET
ncbi:MAG: V-type ATP synthase subunit F [Xanthobacteraceae bacterium]|jgi:vacuolar-type H+-ATPase subunit F/Vma7